jgi:hypothetical protein
MFPDADSLSPDLFTGFCYFRIQTKMNKTNSADFFIYIFL